MWLGAYVAMARARMLILLAPWVKSVCAHSLRVAPVVTRSSTRRRCLCLMALWGDMANPLATFLSRSAFFLCVCDGVSMTRFSQLLWHFTLRMVAMPCARRWLWL